MHLRIGIGPRLVCSLLTALACTAPLSAQTNLAPAYAGTSLQSPAPDAVREPSDAVKAEMMAKLRLRAQRTVAVIALANAAGANCPIALQAERKATGRLYPAQATVGNSNFAGPGLHLTFMRRVGTQVVSGPEIASINLVAHGFTRNPNRAIPAATTFGSPDASQSFRLKADGKPLDHADLQLTQLATVQSVELTHIGFADGTEWNKSAASQCVVKLSGLLLVQ